MGGTRFVGRALVKKLIKKGYDLTVFTRGKNPVPKNVLHIEGDRDSDELNKLKGMKFDVIIDSSGRTLNQTKNVIDITGPPLHRFLYVSSAGIYKDCFSLPLDEGSKIDESSRHIGKAHTEEWLKQSGIPFTIFRPTYIYGPGNYNPIEEWFFDRIVHNRPIPMPLDGSTITQLGHVEDLADAMLISLEKNVAKDSIYNCSGKKGITFKGLIYAASIACGKDPNEIKLVSYDPKGLDRKGRKVFPLRINHFLTDISLIERELNWNPKYSLDKGLSDSFKNDYLKNSKTKPEFKIDIDIIGY